MKPGPVYQNAVFGYWPLEESLTYPALAAIEAAIRSHLKHERLPTEIAAELHNTANIIRALLQHVVNEKREAAAAARTDDPDPLLA